MSVRVNATTRGRARSLQAELLAARETAGIAREALASRLEVSPRTLRDWERRYDSPGLENMFSWARELGFRLVLEDRLGQVAFLPAAMAQGDDWRLQEMRRMIPLLKSRRRDRKVSQTDLSLILGVSKSSLQRWEDGDQLPRLIALVVWTDRLDYRLALSSA